MITSYELYCGLAGANRPDQERQKIEHFVSMIVELPFDAAAAVAAASIRAELERAGTPIGAYDMLIAGQAVASGLILVTNNVREFQRVRGLKLESWP